jgi:hypothetical protein
VTGDMRVTAAREYLDAIRPHKVTTRPPSVLVRECAELRRMLGQVLDVIDSQAPAVLAGNFDLTPEQVRTVLDALDDAADWREFRATSTCQACAEHPAELCEEHQADLDRVDAYRQVARQIGGDR